MRHVATIGKIVLSAAMLLGVLAVSSAQADSSVPALLKGHININAATVKQMTMLPGIGKKTAQRIIDYRDQNGGFAAIDDLLKVRGLGKKTLEQNRPYITLEGETTLVKPDK